ncbi:hypothetical protein C1645_743073 [Glomus cerebriforme]|uniref:Uncharacterized protein n=1 Tax=Glomus cerebriforme TaxID=658196 RepID=A0A397SBT5_9GLOM|nr:hypothetical protein C1645_743073 [Glomus cerebriforme]
MFYIWLNNINTKEELWKYLKKLSSTSEILKILYEKFLVPYRGRCLFSRGAYLSKCRINICMIFQRLPTKYSMSERKAKISDNEHRRSGDSSCHHVRYSCPLLHDQHWRTSEVLDFSRTADGMAVFTFRPVDKVDIDFSANTQRCQQLTNQGQISAVNNKCGLEIRESKDHKDLIQNVTNRIQEYQKILNKDLTGSRLEEPLSISRREFEIEKESNVLAIRQLCENEHMVPFSIMEKRSTNQNAFNECSNKNSEIFLRELRPDHEQQTQSLLNLLKNIYPFHEVTNNDKLYDYEIKMFPGTYGITDFCLVLASREVFWLEVPGGVIYFWSRIDDSMIRGGVNMEEALTNFLFHQENLCYVDECTHKLVPLNEYDSEAEEKWAKSPESHIYADDIKHKYGSKSGKKKKQKKRKNKNKH